MKSAPTNVQPRRRWLRIGPGVLLALTAIAWGWPTLFPPAKPPVVQRTVAAPQTATENAPPSAPDPTWLLGQRRELAMTDAQFQKISALQQRFARDTRELQASIDAATRDFNAGMSADNAATMEGLQARAAPLSELSSQMASARRAWWSEASLALNALQRKSAQTAWLQHLTKAFATENRVP